MQDRKEDSAFSVKNIREKVRDWKSQNLWIACYFEYLILWLLVIFAVHSIFAYFDLLHTDADSARYMLSAMVQSQAAIVAIVVSLTLIAVQLTASTYSLRVIRIFRDNPDMWILLSLYGVSIFYGLFALKMIRGVLDSSQITILNSSLEAYITIVYALGISTFAILFLYLWNIMGLLTSETIIKRLKNEITKGNLLNSKEDPIQPIVDIVHGSIMKYDIETTRVGLKAVTERVIEIIDSNGEKEISRHFCDHLTRASRLAISREDEESTAEVIENLENFWESTTEKGLEDVASQAATSIKIVGITAAKKGLDYATYTAGWSLLVKIGITTAKKGLEGATKQAATFLAELTLLSEENVKTALQDFESKLKEKDRESFQKFMKLYEQALEKLRAEK